MEKYNNKNRRSIYFCIILAVLVLSILLASNILDVRENATDVENNNLSNNIIKIEDLKLSAEDRITLNLSDITQNATLVRRVFQSINFTINATGFTDPKYDYNYTQIQFSFDSQPINMTQSVGDNWTYIYTPVNNAPLGFQEVSFLIFNKTGTQLNTQKTYINFTIIPNVVVNINKYIYNLGESVSGELVVYDFDSLNWTVSVSTGTDPGTESILFDIGSDIFSFSFSLDSKFSFNRAYFIKVYITDKAVINQTYRYFDFFIQNSAPSINQSTIEVSPNQAKRTSNVTIKFDASDVETPTDINASLIIEDSEGNLVATYKNEQVTNHGNGTFEKKFEILKNRPLGQYRVNITVFDPQLSQDSCFAYFTVTNNAPSILNYSVNDLANNESITITYGEDLVFKFNITDEENTIDYITVAMINEDDEWFNVSKKYGVNFSITIRTVDLKMGLWYVYIFATDVDGATVSLTSDLNIAPQEIKIEPNFVDEFYPWLTFLIGLAIGVVLASIIIFSALSRKKRRLPGALEEKHREPKEEKVQEEVKRKKKKKSRKLRRVIKRKKEKTEEEPEEETPTEKEQLKESDEEKKETKKKKPKSEITRRKIKRKLK